MSNMINMIDIASTKFVNNMCAQTKEIVKNGFYFSDIAPEDILIEMGWDFQVDDQIWNDYLRMILDKMTQQGIEYKVASCYEYLTK